jgi:hypothetical protein
MIPTSLIYALPFSLILLPAQIYRAHPMEQEKGKTEKNLTSMSVNLQLSYSHEKSKIIPVTNSEGITKPVSKNLLLPPEKFTEAPLQMEEWMKSPKSWNNNYYYK